MAFQGIGFDLDNTLHQRDETFRHFLEAECAQNPAHTLDLAKATQLDASGYGDKGVLLAYLAGAFAWPESSAEARYDRFVASSLAVLQPEPRLIALLTRLAARFRLGVVSNGRGRYQRSKLERLGIAHLFDPIVISEELGTKKPHRAMFDELTRAWALEAEQIVFVGDSPRLDVEAARQVGMHAVWIRAGKAWSQDTPAPVAVDDVLELERVLA